jgi:hypothetical protein
MNTSSLFFILFALNALYTIYALVVAALSFFSSPGGDPAPYPGYLTIAAGGWLIIGILYLIYRLSRK